MLTTSLKLILFVFAITSSLQSFATSDSKNSSAEKLFAKHCSACHGQSKDAADNYTRRIAPPISGVIMHYKSVHKEKEDFIDAVVEWVDNPDADRTLMPGAIRHFKLMPKMDIPEEEVEQIAAYLFDDNIPIPEAYRKHYEKNHGANGASKSKINPLFADRQFLRLFTRQFRISPDQIESLKLSDEQIKQIRELIVEKEAMMQPLREEVLEFNQQLITMDTRNPDYKSEIFSLADINAKRVEEMVIKSGEMRFKIESVLSNEQYKTLLNNRNDLQKRFESNRR